MSEELDEIEISARLFLDKSTILYGQSGSGKTTLITDILWNLNKHIKQIIAFSPTDPVNRSYSGTWGGDSGVVPKPLIHYTISESILIKLWARQEMFAAVYSRANQITVIERLFRKLNLGNVNKVLEQAEISKSQSIKRIETTISDPNMQRKKLNELEEQFKNFYVLIYKRYIVSNKDFLLRMNLDADEKFALKFLDFNPRMVIIFDDCSADFKKISKEGKVILEKMFFQNRWAFLTVIIAVHDDKLLNSELRKNAYLSIFTTKQAMHAYFKRDTNAFSAEMQKIAAAFGNRAFEVPNQKVMYMRQTDKLYAVTATPRDDKPFTFGSNSIQEYCNMIQSTGSMSIDKNNEFYQYFQTP